MDIQAYLTRIGYRGSTQPNEDTLRALHRGHMLSVPFEDLDIHLGREIVLDTGRFFDKIVNQRRGGFCYELNGAFAGLLIALGFRVALLSARVSGAEGALSAEFDHLTLRVDLEEPWLADVGFADCFIEPLRLTCELVQQDPAGRFRLIDTNGRCRLERMQPDSSWRPQYEFSLVPRQLHEFAERCRYHQASPESHFVQNRICSLARPDGRITVSGMRLIVTSNGTKTERELTRDADWRAALQRDFGIALDAKSSPAARK